MHLSASCSRVQIVFQFMLVYLEIVRSRRSVEDDLEAEVSAAQVKKQKKMSIES